MGATYSPWKSRAARIERRLDEALFGFVIGFAIFTLLYWVALAFALSLDWLLPVGAAVTVITMVSLRFKTLELMRGPKLEGSHEHQTLLAVAMSLGAGILASIVVRPDADDYFYVNRTRWVADRGTIPWGDTIYSSGVFPRPPSYLLTSFEVLLGLLARLLQVDAGTLTYTIVPPLSAAAAVWALWALIRSWDLRRPSLSLVLSMGFLLLAATTHAGAPNLFIARLWQGKILFFAILLPLIWSLAPKLAKGLWPVLFAVAGAGLTTSALFVLPVVFLAGSGGCWFVTRKWSWTFLAGPLTCCAFVVVLQLFDFGSGGPPSIQLDSAEILAKSFGSPIFLVLLLVSVIGGIVAIRARESRFAVIIAAVILAIGLAPPVLHFVEDGPGSAIAWRMVWWLPTVSLFGAAVSSISASVKLTALLTLGMTALIAPVSVPVWSAANGASLSSPGGWKLPDGSRAQAHALTRLPPESVVLAPTWTSIALAASSSYVHTIAGRADYVEVRSNDPNFHADERQLLAAYVNGFPRDAKSVRLALDTVEVSHVCIPTIHSLDLVPIKGWVGVKLREDLICYHRHLRATKSD